MIEVFQTLFRVLEEIIPNEEIRKDLYADIIPSMHYENTELLNMLEAEDPAFGQACQEFREDVIDENK